MNIDVIIGLILKGYVVRVVEVMEDGLKMRLFFRLLDVVEGGKRDIEERECQRALVDVILNKKWESFI